MNNATKNTTGKLARIAVPSLLAVALLTVGAPAQASPAIGSVPVGRSATQVLSTLTVGVKPNVSSDRKSHQWNKVEGKTGNYTTRDLVLERDMTGVTHTTKGNVKTGTLSEPYTGRTIHFQRGQSNKTEGGSASNRDGGIQIDHVVAYAEAYRSGLNRLDFQQRDAYYNDPDVLLASQAEANNVKKDGTIAEWEPSNRAFRCDYASLQIGIKAKYGLMVDQREHDALARTLASCPSEPIVSTGQVRQRLTGGKSGSSNIGGTGNGHASSGGHESTSGRGWVRNLFGGLLKRFL